MIKHLNLYLFIVVISVFIIYKPVQATELVDDTTESEMILPEEEQKELFEDVEKDSWYYESVIWAIENKITTGMQENFFGVDEICTRGQGLTFIWRAEGAWYPRILNEPFVDVTSEDWFYNAVLWGMDNRVTTGTSVFYFEPDRVMTRAQFVTFLYRLMGEESNMTENPFEDVPEDAYYRDAVLWAVEKGITTGMTENMFAPEALCQRTQSVTFLWRAYHQEPENVEIDDIEITDFDGSVNAKEYGLSPDNSGLKNSIILQELIDTVAEFNGIIYIPAGEYKFSESGQQSKGTSYCVKMKSNITIVGEGEKTILKPTGRTEKGLDMFYFNDYIDTGEVVYLENCNFKSFVIDAERTSCRQYSSAGKGFMINLFKNCNWKNVIVRNTDATGFGMDCPIGGSIIDCVAIDCGKAARVGESGASGFGIGFGYSEEENFKIENCEAYGNKNFGFFFEHQKRFNRTRYQAEKAEAFVVNNCVAIDNYYNFGGLLAMDTMYANCFSGNALKDGFYFENSKNCTISECISAKDADVSFAIVRSKRDGGDQFVNNIIFTNCRSSETPMGAVIKNLGVESDMTDNTFENCQFDRERQTFIIQGEMEKLSLKSNNSEINHIIYEARIKEIINIGNSWEDNYFEMINNSEPEIIECYESGTDEEIVLDTAKIEEKYEQ